MSEALRLEDVPAAFIAAWNRHDMAALAALFAEDADFVNVVGLWWRSRAEIEAAHAATHATSSRTAAWKATSPRFPAWDREPQRCT
ncbi:SgcJ/EcaC family oxidoreductase [Inquilinus limosus]